MSEKHRHHNHHKRREPPKDDYNWWWIVFVLIFVGLFLVIFLVPWRYSLAPPPVKEEFDSPSQNGGNGSPFVFKKRTDRHQCKTGEFWFAEDNMCAPLFNTPSSFEGSIMNVTMNMCDDFFNSMCGRWNAEHTNEDRAFSYGYHRNQASIKRLVQNPQNKDIRSFYESCLSAIHELDTHESELETKHVLEHIAGSLKGYGDLPTVFGRLARYGYTSPFIFSIEKDFTQKRLIPFFTADSFNFSSPVVMQTFEEARSVTKHTSLMLMDKVRRTVKVIQHLNTHNTEPIEGIVDFMDYLRSGGFADDIHLFKELGVWNTPHENTGGWTLFFQALDGSALRLSQEQPVWTIGFPYMQWLLKDGLRGVEIMDWLAFVEFSILYNTRQFYPALSNNAYLQTSVGINNLVVSNRVGRGPSPRINRRSLEETQQKEQYCVEVAQNMLPGLVAQTFLKEMMPKKEIVRSQVKEMVDRIVVVYRGFIQGSTWLRQHDKDAALKKLDTLVVRIIEPDEWEAEPFAQRISPDRYDHNMNMIRRYRVHRNVQQWHLNKEPQLSIPFVAPLTDVNAYYSGTSNSITILAGILQKPFYNIDYDEVTRYAIAGSIIGHELGHMFDPQGLLWDADGTFKPEGIWSRDGMISFRERAKCVVSEFGDTPSECLFSSPPEGGEENSYGKMTLGEDLADLIGIRLSYKAYFDNTPSATSGNRQYFFMSFAQAWCSSYDTEHKCARVKNDVHAIAEYRVDRTLRNIPEFARVFGCPKRDKNCVIYE
jgi:predicted metalloendopeptidase